MSVDLTIRIGLHAVEAKWHRRRGKIATDTFSAAERKSDGLTNGGAIGACLNSVLSQTLPRRFFVAPHVRVALADPYLRVAVLQFAQLPGSRADRKLLVTQRFCHDHSLHAAETVVAFETCRTKRGEPGAVIASAVPASWLGETQALLRRHRLYADIIAPESAFAIRRMAGWLSPPPRILLLIYPDYLLILIWTEDATPQHMATLRPETPEGDGFGAKVARRLLRYLSGEPIDNAFAIDVFDAAPGASLSTAVHAALKPLSSRLRDLRTHMPSPEKWQAGADLRSALISEGI